MTTSTPATVPHGYALPPFAPLNAPLIAQVLHQHLATPSVLDAISRYPAGLAWLLRTLPTIRQHVFSDLDSLARTGDLGVSEFLSFLRAASVPNNRPNPQVLANWRGRGILRTSRHGYLEPQRAAAILIVRRLLPQATRNWLPEEIAPREPDWWCWRQDGPTLPITTCPVPLPPDLPSSALLWVPWAGATWLPDWLPATTGALYCGLIQSPQTLAKAAQVWQLALGTSAHTNDEVNNDSTDVQEAWIRLMSPLVLARFTSILTSIE